MSAISNTDKGEVKAPDKTRRRWTIWRVLGWLIVSLLLIILLAAAYAWTHRYQLIENVAHDLLAEEGIESEFRIKSISKTKLVIDDVRLSADGTPFFETKSVTADYFWRDALEGRMKRLAFNAPKAWVTIDDKGNIIDGWMPPQSSDGTGTVLPPEGIHLNNATLYLTSPYGEIEALGDATVNTLEDFKADLKFKPAELTYQDYTARSSGEVKINYQKAKQFVEARIALNPTTIMSEDLNAEGEGTLVVNLGGNTPEIKADLDFPVFDHRLVQTKNLSVVGDFVPQVSEEPRSIDGTLSFSFDELTAAEAKTGNGKLKWSGHVEMIKDTPESLIASGTWSIDAAKAALTSAARRRSFAEGLTLNNALSNAPVSNEFAEPLTALAAHVLSGANLQGSGTLDLNAEQLVLSLTEPLTLRAPKTVVRARASGSRPFYNFDRKDKKLGLNMNVGFTGPYKTELQNLVFRANSDTGYSLNRVTAFSGKIQTAQTWNAETDDGKPVRLAPFSASIDYGYRGDTRKLSMIGDIDYDGEIPGGYAAGLKTAGELDVVLLGDGLQTIFQPSNDAPITITRFDTAVGWRGEDLSFNLVSTAPFYTRRGDVGTLEAELSGAAGMLIDDVDARHLDMTFETLNASGTLENGRQDWKLKAGGIKILSDDVPGPGTEVQAAEADMTVSLLPDEAPKFHLTSQSADIKSRLVNADHLAVDVKGTPDNFKLDYANGLIKFTADALPALPMSGDVTFANGEWTGSAMTNLPKAEDAPIDVVYRFKDGFGEADVTIEKITFKPKGFQPQSLLPALAGKISQVEGTASADIKLAFGEGQELQSSGVVKIMDMNAGTLPGPLTGMSTEIVFSSLFPVQTEGRQTMTLRRFDPGLPLENGTVEYELLPNAVKIYSASWPMGEGAILIDPVTWDFGAEENRVTLRVDGVSLGDFLAKFGGGDIKATGDVIGVLPVVIRGVDVKVEDGVIGVPNGGVIQFESRHTDAAGGENKAADMAFEALKNFKYNALEATMNGPLDGDISIFLDFIGTNPDAFYGAKFHFKVNIQGELVNIARSFKQSQDVLGENIKTLLNKKKEPKSPESENLDK